MLVKKASDSGHNKRSGKFRSDFQRSPWIVFTMKSLVALLFILVSTLAYEYDYYDGYHYDFSYDYSKLFYKSETILYVVHRYL